jgi:hypothetical protein
LKRVRQVLHRTLYVKFSSVIIFFIASKSSYPVLPVIRIQGFACFGFQRF